MTPNQISNIKNTYKGKIDDHLEILKTKKNTEIQKLQNNIKQLEAKFNTIKGYDTRNN
jgi:hypothetical protein